MSRYIDADALIQLGLQDGAYEYVSVKEIADFPTADVVEVVRCKDCENWDRHWISSTFTKNAHHCTVLDNVFDGEFYCACGHRRRNNEV